MAENRITCVWAKKKCKIFQKSPAAAPQAHPFHTTTAMMLPAGAANLFASLIPQSWDRNAAAADWRWRVHRSVAFIATFNMLIIILFTRNWISLGRHSSSLSQSRRSCDARCQPCCNDSRHSCRTQEVRGKKPSATNKKKKLRETTKGNTNYMKYSNGCNEK